MPTGVVTSLYCTPVSHLGRPQSPTKLKAPWGRGKHGPCHRPCLSPSCLVGRRVPGILRAPRSEQPNAQHKPLLHPPLPDAPHFVTSVDLPGSSPITLRTQRVLARLALCFQGCTSGPSAAHGTAGQADGGLQISDETAPLRSPYWAPASLQPRRVPSSPGSPAHSPAGAPSWR